MLLVDVPELWRINLTGSFLLQWWSTYSFNISSGELSWIRIAHVHSGRSQHTRIRFMTEECVTHWQRTLVHRGVQGRKAERLRYVDNVQFIGPCQIIGFKPFKMFRHYWQKICNLNYCFGESQRMYICKNQVNPCKNITHLMFAISTWDFYTVMSQSIPHFEEKVEQELSWT